MLNALRVVFTDTNKDDIAQEKYISDSLAFHGRRATSQIHTYQVERLWKQNYILVNVVAEGYDQKRFLEHMVKAKSKFSRRILILMFCSTDTTPNVDHFTREELRDLIRTFKDEMSSGNLDEVSS